MIQEFHPEFDRAAWEDLRERLRRTSWPRILSGDSESHGFPLETLQKLCNYWSTEFDWLREWRRIADLPSYLLKSRHGNVHFIHIRSGHAEAVPLLMTHGWPGSFLEFVDLIPLLVNVGRGQAGDGPAFDLIIPSLPGFAYSDPITDGLTDAFRVADIWVELMEALGHRRFGLQGGDLGAAVCTAVGLRHPERVIGMHLNYVPGSYQPFLANDAEISADERQFLANARRWYEENGAYAHLQSTSPQTAAYALTDSPAGLAAWMLDKFKEWSGSGDLDRSFSRDLLLTNVTLYWMTKTIGSSFLMYYGGKRHPLHFREHDFVDVPCAFAHFPGEISFPPRSWVERGYRVTRWTSMKAGGHFAASEQPEALAADIRAFFAGLRFT